jgi:hypothetical protein
MIVILNMKGVGPESCRMYRVGTDRNKWTRLVDRIVDKTLDRAFGEAEEEKILSDRLLNGYDCAK